VLKLNEEVITKLPCAAIISSVYALSFLRVLFLCVSTERTVEKVAMIMREDADDADGWLRKEGFFRLVSKKKLIL